MVRWLRDDEREASELTSAWEINQSINWMEEWKGGGSVKEWGFLELIWFLRAGV